MHFWVYVLESDDGRHWAVGVSKYMDRIFNNYRYVEAASFPRRLVLVYRYFVPHAPDVNITTKDPGVREFEHSIVKKMMLRAGGLWRNVNSIYGRFGADDDPPVEFSENSQPLTCFCGYPAEKRRVHDGGVRYCCARADRLWMRNLQLPDFMTLNAMDACEYCLVVDEAE